MLEITLAEAVERSAKEAPSRGYRFISEAGVPGFSKSEQANAEASFSFSAIERTSARYGAAMQAMGLKKGDRVAFILPENEDFVLCFFGAIRAGIVPVPIYPPFGLGQFQAYLDNTKHIVAKSGARVLITQTNIKRMLGTVQEHCPTLEQIVSVDTIRESQEVLRQEKIGLGDVAFLQFTSGSTSRPKGVTVTHGNLAANIHCIMVDGLRANGETDVGVS
ncbi:MAG: acyl--CoA ligase, partial [Polyangiaceae bacterium]|nr:acyl--CoA ligase [Polyangiaceae bacterium]